MPVMENDSLNPDSGTFSQVDSPDETSERGAARGSGSAKDALLQGGTHKSYMSIDDSDQPPSTKQGMKLFAGRPSKLCLSFIYSEFIYTIYAVVVDCIFSIYNITRYLLGSLPTQHYTEFCLDYRLVLLTKHLNDYLQHCMIRTDGNPSNN